MNLIARGLESAAGRAAELSLQFRNGELSSAGIIQGLTKSIPIVGHLVSAAHSIKELVTGEQAARMRVTAELEQQKRFGEYQVANVKAQQKHWETIAEIMRGISQREQSIGLRGYEAGQQSSSNATANRVQDLRKKRDAELEALEQRRADAGKRLGADRRGI